MTKRPTRELPEHLAVSPSKNGFTLIDASKASPSLLKIPTSNPLYVARILHELMTDAKQPVNMYAFFAPKVDKDGKTVLVKDAKGNVLVDDEGKTKPEVIDLGRAIRDVEDGKRVATIGFGYYGQFKVNLLWIKAKETPKAAADQFDVAAYFMDKYKSKK